MRRMVPCLRFGWRLGIFWRLRLLITRIVSSGWRLMIGRVYGLVGGLSLRLYCGLIMIVSTLWPLSVFGRNPLGRGLAFDGRMLLIMVLRLCLGLTLSVFCIFILWRRVGRHCISVRNMRHGLVLLRGVAIWIRGLWLLETVGGYCVRVMRS